MIQKNPEKILIKCIHKTVLGALLLLTAPLIRDCSAVTVHNQDLVLKLECLPPLPLVLQGLSMTVTRGRREQPVQERFAYMGQPSPAFAKMADVMLVVEGRHLPVHSMILGANSNVFAEIFNKAIAQQPDSWHLLEVPLVGDSLSDVTTALSYLYQGCTVWLASTLVISTLEDAVSLARFAHKYGIEHLLQACQQHLVRILKLHIAGSDKSLSQSSDMAHLTDLAETCEMHELLAHCELVMIKSTDCNLWTDDAMLSEKVSRHSLLRMLRAPKHSGASTMQPSAAFTTTVSRCPLGLNVPQLIKTSQWSS